VNLSHPNIAAPIAADLDYGAPYLAQEYAVGDSLDVVLRERGPMAIRDVVALVESLAGAIDYAAGRGVHHGLLHLRDIVLGADTARITGLGLSAALSKVGARMPTRPQYSSPDTPSDVYSLAAIAFEAATGKRVSADNLKDFEAEHGAALREAFDAPLAANPESRPASAGAFAEALLGATGAAGAKAAPVAPTAPVAPITPIAPLAPTAPVAPIAPEDPLDRVIDPEPDVPDLTEDFVPLRQSPSRLLEDSDVEPEPVHRRWPIVAMFLAFAIFVALAAGFFLQASDPAPVAENQPGVEGTVVDLPAPASPGASAGKPAASAARGARNAPGASNSPSASSTPRPPAPSPSRPASGAVQRAQTGGMLIRSTPADADVLVNGTLRGKTPLALRDLALGSYTIRVARDGYAEEERTLQLTTRRPTSSTTINLRSEKTGPGVLNVQSRPTGARVFVNDQLAGSTPIAIPGLSAGSATVRIELDGYKPWTATVRVAAGEQTRVAASLERQ